jgi:hypothetical protein
LTAELLLIVFVYGVGVLFIWPRYAALEGSSWYGLDDHGSLHLSPAGWWFALVSLPFFQFLLFRWYYRLFIWARFLWQVLPHQTRPLPDASRSRRRPRISFER